MANTFTLDAIREAAEAKYADTTVVVGDQEVVLLNPLRLSADRRKTLTEMSDKFKADDADQFAVFTEVILAAAKDAHSGKALVAALDGDLTVAVTLFEMYMKGVEAGEA